MKDQCQSKKWESKTPSEIETPFLNLLANMFPDYAKLIDDHDFGSAEMVDTGSQGCIPYKQGYPFVIQNAHVNPMADTITLPAVEPYSTASLEARVDSAMYVRDAPVQMVRTGFPSICTDLKTQKHTQNLEEGRVAGVWTAFADAAGQQMERGRYNWMLWNMVRGEKSRTGR